ncbi:hypothetical protein [Pseudogemmobacter blasticus]|uniref:Uncharacterized protein n=2 Tax=Fuscovulum blasticum TaxID=1075 RepID=A0A2T4JE16_FUSBL|nr:hypothetical protein [Fuscovulum blasticum]AWD22996.1 hypothetical protein B6K69_16040 [Fuscovulum blasticum]PTE16139.1 hypothetical protein C5F44_03750 [Fuscovulum blasticum DSM 2131]
MALALSACVRPDGSPALGASDAQQVFTFVLNGKGSSGGHCTAEGARGEVRSGKDLFGSPTVKIRGHIRYGKIICTDGQGVKYVTTINQLVPQGLRTPRAWSNLRPGKTAHDVKLELPSGVTRIFYKALIRVE